jgi:hypothetical protein
LVANIALVVAGGGAFALDNVLFKSFAEKKQAQYVGERLAA